MRRVIASVLAAGLALAACETRSPEPAAQQPDRAKPAPGEPARAQTKPERNPAPASEDPGLARVGDIHYLEFVTGDAEADAELPMIVAIHGLGDSPEGFRGVLAGFDQPARVIVPRALEAYGPGWSWFPYRASEGDLDTLSAGIRHAADTLAPAIEELARSRPTRGKPIVTGFSQGGMLSFALAVEHGELIAAALPIGGWLPDPMWPRELPTAAPPIRAYHGEADERVPYAPTQAAVEHLAGLGWTVTLESYPGVEHTISQPMHRDWSQALREQLAEDN